LLQKTIDDLVMDREKLIDTKNAIKESYDILEKKLEDTNSLLDKRVQDVDDLSKKLNSSYSTMDRVEYELKQATGDL
jgi:predicted transcriptional regulator